MPITSRSCAAWSWRGQGASGDADQWWPRAAPTPPPASPTRRSAYVVSTPRERLITQAPTRTALDRWNQLDLSSRTS